MDDFLRDQIDNSRATVAAQTSLKAALEAHCTLDSAADLQDKTVRSEAVGVVTSWVERDGESMEEGEVALDSLYGMMFDTVGAEEDEPTDDQNEHLDLLTDAVADYLLSNGATEEDVDAILYDDSEEAAAAAAARVHEMLVESMDNGDSETAMDSVVRFVNAPNLDGLTMDGVSWSKMHRGRSTVHSKHGKKKVTRHRMKWRRASVAQKVALKKNSRRAHTASAKLLNLRSNIRTRKLGGRRVV